MSISWLIARRFSLRIILKIALMLSKRKNHNMDSIHWGGAKSFRAIFIILHLLLLISFASVCLAAPETDTKKLEYKVKAAYLYNFTKFVKWPDEAFGSSPDSPLNICILGKDPFGNAIDLLANKTAKGRKVSVTYLDSIETNETCHVMFVSKSMQKDVELVIEKFAEKNVLTVSDIDGFAVKGGCIRLHVIKGKVRFNINVGAANQANLKVSAKLLELAKVVIE